MSEPYLLRKSGMFYGHNSCGYVSRVMLAELYTKEYALKHAKQCDEVTAIPLSELHVDVDEVQEYVDRLVEMRDFLLTLENAP